MELNPCAGPPFIRLIYGSVFRRWHSAGTYDVQTKTGGPFGTMKLEQECKHCANNGIEIAVKMLEEPKKEFPNLTFADYYQVSKTC